MLFSTHRYNLGDGESLCLGDVVLAKFQVLVLNQEEEEKKKDESQSQDSKEKKSVLPEEDCSPVVAGAKRGRGRRSLLQLQSLRTRSQLKWQNRPARPRFEVGREEQVWPPRWQQPARKERWTAPAPAQAARDPDGWSPSSVQAAARHL